ncbi:hypothetical protein MJ524_17915 [Escherichia coli]|nr:hypothetical protein MJ524_17915 [Escherichia coli]
MKWPITPMPLSSWITTYSAVWRLAGATRFTVLILNGMKGLYTRIGRHYFANPGSAQSGAEFLSSTVGIVQ